MAVATPAGLAGKRVLVTRSRARGMSMVARLQQWGAIPLWIPVIAATPGTPLQLTRALTAARTCEWLVLPSPLAIEVFCDFAVPQMRVTGWPRTVVMGETSGRLLARRYGIEPSVVCNFSRNVTLAVQMGLQPQERVVILRSDRGSGPRIAALAQAHAHVDSHVVYAVTCAADLVSRLDRLVQPPDAVTFTSPFSVDCFMDAAEQTPHLQAWLSGACIACIGPSTARASTRRGLNVTVTCATPSADNLLMELAHWFAFAPALP